MARKFAAVVFSMGCLQASTVMALGLGELEMESFLNEPLQASVDLLNTGGLHEDEIKVRLATREDFQKMGLDRAYFLTSIKFDVEKDDGGNARIIMTTDAPVLEPYLDFIIEARWPSGRLLREYTVLIDPPVFEDTESTPVVSASQRVEEVEGIPAPAKKKTEVAPSSGTQVDLKRSDLAPGAMPQRTFSADTSIQPLPGSRYMISRDQTLWQIASQAKPDGVSVHQTMLDIQRLNPDAFINDNINNIKAGYIIYLPGAEDISSGDVDAALAEVKLQNQAWEEGRDAELAASGPRLRITADVEEASGGSLGEESAEAAMEEPESVPVAPGMEGLEGPERLAAMEQQVETLQRIVDVKDEQIAALQAALSDAQSSQDQSERLAEDITAAAVEGDEQAEVEAALEDAVDAESAEVIEELESVEGIADTEPEPVEEEVVEEVVTDEPVAAVEPAKPGPAVKPESGGGIMDYAIYIIGAVVLAMIGFLFARRRRGAEQEDVGAAPDVFSDVQLKEQPVEAASEADTREEVEDTEEGRGYGERRHDAYASDMEDADALAEADIYIAYGRHTQAIDLLNNALVNEPENPVYRLKLLEIHTELNDRVAAEQEFERIKISGDTVSIDRGKELLAALDAEPAPSAGSSARSAGPTAGGQSAGLAPNPLELMSDGDAQLDSEFSELEIEDPSATDVEDDLDLSPDFADDGGDDDGEDLVIAADANGMSTKLDLARAYLDMGDDDGARQILEEVLTEGTEDLKAEARGLLERIG